MFTPHVTALHGDVEHKSFWCHQAQYYTGLLFVVSGSALIIYSWYAIMSG